MSKTLIFKFLALVVVANPSLAADETSLYKREGRTSFKELTHDFGQVFRGQKLQHSFEFENTGRGPMNIQGVHATCGCTVVDIDKTKVYQPGDKGKITITLDTTDFRGKVSKSVTVMTTAKLLPTRSLTVKAEIKEEVFADPPLIDFGEVHVAAQEEAETHIKVMQDSQVRVTGLRFDDSKLDAKLHTEDGKQYLRVRLKKGLKAGFFKENVFVKTTSNSLREFPVPIRADLLGSFSYSPNYIEFGAIARDSEVAKEVKITSEKAHKILDAQMQVNVNGFDVENVEKLISIEPDADGGNLTVKLRNAVERSGSVHGRLTLKTTDPAQDELVIDFYAFFQK